VGEEADEDAFDFDGFEVDGECSLFEEGQFGVELPVGKRPSFEGVQMEGL
jgi:hypothetical protein